MFIRWNSNLPWEGGRYCQSYFSPSFCYGSWFQFADTFEKKNSKKKFLSLNFFYFVWATFGSTFSAQLWVKLQRQDRVKFQICFFSIFFCIYSVSSQLTMFEIRKWNRFLLDEIRRHLDQKFWSSIDLFLKSDFCASVSVESCWTFRAKTRGVKQ